MLEVPVLTSLQWPSFLITLVAAALVFRFQATVLVTLVVTGTLGVAAMLL
jgi:hypothetical protein